MPTARRAAGRLALVCVTRVRAVSVGRLLPARPRRVAGRQTLQPFPQVIPLAPAQPRSRISRLALGRQIRPSHTSIVRPRRAESHRPMLVR